MRLKRLVEKLLDSVFVAEFSLCLRCNRLVFGLGNYMYYVYLVYGPEICEYTIGVIVVILTNYQFMDSRNCLSSL